ncbi:MAG: ParB/RepB/Spo0J family partition protein [Fibrobacterota bacterium]
MASKRRLGRGLEALISKKPEDSFEETGSSDNNGNSFSAGIIETPLDKIEPSPFQYRKVFSEDSIAEMAESIKTQGLVEPVLLRPHGDKFQIVCGERRFRAFCKLGKETIPSVIRKFTDKEISEIGLIENIQREDLNEIDLASAYNDLLQKHGYSQEELGKRIGKSRSSITNILRLLKLPEEVRSALVDKKISYGHARALISAGTVKEQEALLEKIISESLSVRELERILNPQPKEPLVKKKTPPKDPDIISLEDELCRKLNSKVSLSCGKNGSGSITIKYFSSDDLERILTALRH